MLKYAKSIFSWIIYPLAGILLFLTLSTLDGLVITHKIKSLQAQNEPAASIIDPPQAGTVEVLPAKEQIPSTPPSLSNVPTKQNRLSALFVLDELFDTGPVLLMDKRTTSLGDLLLLNALFNDGRLLDPDNKYDLADLYILDELFDTDPPLQLESGKTSLKDILFLDQLFR